jgi:hypothetical protein
MHKLAPRALAREHLCKHPTMTPLAHKARDTQATCPRAHPVGIQVRLAKGQMLSPGPILLHYPAQGRNGEGHHRACSEGLPRHALGHAAPPDSVQEENPQSRPQGPQDDPPNGGLPDAVIVSKQHPRVRRRRHPSHSSPHSQEPAHSRGDRRAAHKRVCEGVQVAIAPGLHAACLPQRQPAIDPNPEGAAVQLPMQHPPNSADRLPRQVELAV